MGLNSLGQLIVLSHFHIQKDYFVAPSEIVLLTLLRQILQAKLLLYELAYVHCLIQALLCWRHPPRTHRSMFTRTLLHRRGICANPVCHTQGSLLRSGCCFSRTLSSWNLSGGTYHYLEYSLTCPPVSLLFSKDFSQSIESQ